MRRAQAGWLNDDARAARGHDLRRRRATLERQRQRLIDAYAVGAVTLEELQARVQALDARLRDLVQEEQQLAASEEHRAQVAALAAQLEAFRATIAAGLDHASFARRRELVELLIDRVLVDPPEVEIRYIIPFGGAVQRKVALRLRHQEPGGREEACYPTLSGLVGGSLNVKHIRAQWDEVLRLAASIKQGTVTASLMLRKLGSYPRQNGLAVALRELGRIERTLFTLDWLQHVELRRQVQRRLNNGEAKNALARAVFFNRLGELRDRSFENQRYRASGLNLVIAAIVLWNTTYLERAVAGLTAHGHTVDDALLPHLSPLGWEHINLTSDYLWRQSQQVERGKFRSLRRFGLP